MKIGVCGTGRMGSAIAERLMTIGQKVGVWNRTPDKTKPLTDAGAEFFASPAGLADGCDIVIVIVLNDAASEAVYRGTNGLLEARVAGKLVIDMSIRCTRTPCELSASQSWKRAVHLLKAPSEAARVPRGRANCWPLSGVTNRTSRAQCLSLRNCAAGSSMSDRWGQAQQ